MNAPVRPHPEGCVISVRAMPNAPRSEVTGIVEDAVKIRIKAPPVEGKANKALVEFLAEALGLRRRDVELLRGETARNKQILIRGLSPDQLRKRLNL
jgi:uncharacterized protein (TIGR00251 family)